MAWPPPATTNRMYTDTGRGLSAGLGDIKSTNPCQTHDNRADVAGLLDSVGTVNVDKNQFPINRLQDTTTFTRFLQQQVMVAETLRSNPIICTQSRKVTNNDDAGTTWTGSEEAIRRQKEDRVEGLERVVEFQRGLRAGEWGSSGIIRTDVDGYNVHDECQPLEFSLLAEQDLANTSMPMSAVGELHKYQAAADDTICRVFSIPPGMVGGKISNDSNANQLQQFSLNSMVQRTKMCIERFLNDCADLSADIETNANPADNGTILDQTGDMEDGKKRKKKKRKKRELGPTGIDLPEEDDDDDDEVVFPRHTFHDIDNGTDAHRGKRIVIPGAPCLSPADVQAMIESGNLGPAEGGHIIRGVVGARPITDKQLLLQQNEADERKIRVAVETATRMGAIQTHRDDINEKAVTEKQPGGKQDTEEKKKKKKKKAEEDDAKVKAPAGKKAKHATATE